MKEVYSRILSTQGSFLSILILNESSTSLYNERQSVHFWQDIVKKVFKTRLHNIFNPHVGALKAIGNGLKHVKNEVM